ncbi:MAG: YceI family protein [Flavobacteriaceae bacterium]|nr:YceI family protein [Flavobacteriaceae bacterium]
MKNSILPLLIIITFSFSAIAQSESKLVSKKTHFKFYSHTAIEDIEANNYKSVGTINTATGEIVFSIPMQSYEFEKAKMQQHYNSKKFLDTKKFPKSKLKGKITNLSDVDFKSDGTYNIQVEGTMTIHGETKNINEKATITVKGANIVLNSKFNLTLEDYGIAFKDGKPSTNIAKTIEISVVAEY